MRLNNENDKAAVLSKAVCHVANHYGLTQDDLGRCDPLELVEIAIAAMRLNGSHENVQEWLESPNKLLPAPPIELIKAGNLDAVAGLLNQFLSASYVRIGDMPPKEQIQLLSDIRFVSDEFVGSSENITEGLMTEQDHTPLGPENTRAIAEQLLATIKHAFDAHTNHPNTPRDSVRFWDGETPYAVHPTWSAMTVLCEPRLDRKTRFNGALALQLHDVLEDTQLPLPDGLPPEVVELVEQMTFTSFSEEQEVVWSRSPTVRMLKLIDKTSNLLDASWMKREKLRNYMQFTTQLADDVEQHYGTLNTVVMARALIAVHAGR